MRIQVINYEKAETENNIIFSTLSAPQSLDEFDVNIIDLSNVKIWYNNGSAYKHTNCIKDFQSIKEMVINSESSIIVYVLPQNVDFHYNYQSKGIVNGKQQYGYDRIKLKDMLVALKECILPQIHPFCKLDLVYENTHTPIGNELVSAAFFFGGDFSTITESQKSKKPTTITTSEKILVTTLDICSSTESVLAFTSFLFEKNKKQARPDWINSLVFNDDITQRERIRQQNQIIQDAEREIEKAKGILEENEKYKSILYTNGDELVSVVFDILEQMLQCDLSEFVDEKKEDFLIKKANYSLIGEIKGITSNVRSENVSQLETHYQGYRDKLQDEGREENVYSILIINPLRNKPLNEREPVHDIQIRLAERNGSLIIETKTLLTLFEMFLQGKLTTSVFETTITNTCGLLETTDFGSE